MPSHSVVSDPRMATLPRLFESQVERTADAIAVAFGGQALTYLELNRRANQLAHCLRAGGVGRETPVGLYCNRSLELMVAALAIGKAGGAFVPVDAKCPAARRDSVLRDAGTKLVLTQQILAAE